MKCISDLDLNGNEIKKPILEKASVAPSNPREGQIYYDSVNKVYKYWDGSSWSTYEKNIIIGTEATRLALTTAPNGILFHQIDVSTGNVTRYIRDAGVWILIEDISTREAKKYAESAEASATLAEQLVSQTYAFTGEGQVPDFNPTEGIYTANKDIVKYQNKYYRCIIDHTESPWDPNHFVETSLYAEYQRLLGSTQSELVAVKIEFSDNINLPSGFDITSLTVTLQNNTTGSILTAHPDSEGRAYFSVPYEESYSVSSPVVQGYVTPAVASHVANIVSRPINFIYYIGSQQSAGFIIDQSAISPEVTQFGRMDVLERILDDGSYVIDEVHEAYAKLSRYDHGYFADQTPWDGTYGNAFRHIPRVYFDVDQTNDYTLYLSDQQISNKYWEDSWIGIYKGYVDGSNRLRSIPGVAATGNKTMTVFWNHAQVMGMNYGLVNYFDQCKLIALHAAYFGTRNSDETMGPGLRDAGNSATYYNPVSGYTAALGDGTGSMRFANTLFNQNKLFGIEALAGSQWEFRPNIRFTSNQIIIYEGNIVDNTATGRTLSRTLTSASGVYTTQMELGAYCDLIPKAVGGSSNTYWCDGTWASTSGQILYVGGDSSHGSLAGLACANSNNAFSNSAAYIGARLAFKGDITKYNFVSGADLRTLNS